MNVKTCVVCGQNFLGGGTYQGGSLRHIEGWVCPSCRTAQKKKESETAKVCGVAIIGTILVLTLFFWILFASTLS